MISRDYKCATELEHQARAVLRIACELQRLAQMLSGRGSPERGFDLAQLAQHERPLLSIRRLLQRP